MKNEDNDIEKNNKELVQEEPSILKPTTSSDIIIDRSKQIDNNQLSKRVEHYNFNNGFQNPNLTNNNINFEEISNINKEQVNTRRITIKTRKSSNILIIILLIVIVLGLFLYFFINKPNKKEVSNTPNIENKDTDLSKPQIKEIVCTKRADNTTFGYNYIQERKFYSLENKLKSYEFTDSFEYINVPATITNVCNSINQNYKEYEGYSYICSNDENTYSYITKVDLEKLLDKELVFNINSNNIKKVIKENLDDDVSNYIKEYEDEGYKCDTEN